ncbi:hypothetical protein RhiirA1_417102 [Rhizophagus irregularis]|uniref:Uncharacterized protein n=1 Tax=Rhizophagus irregularis TaxID=588596 RepID=A0A2N0RY47_9GLOM|nr:hypothetical protein RhiirA1_417102 [Rhizophagus irregularis]CAB4491813.1 unnamed protein product [Rhizophagus irregularis]
MSENQGENKLQKFKKKVKNSFKKMFKRKRNIPNEDIQQHGNNEIKEEETDTSSNLQQNQPVEGNREIKHKNESIDEEPEKKRPRKEKEIRHGDDSSSPIEPIEDESIEMKRIKQQLEEELSERQKYKIELEKLKQSHKKLEEEKVILVSSIESYKANYETTANNIDSLQKQLEEKDTELKGKEDEFIKLEEKNAELRKEASKYQSALGNATNTRLGDEDSVKFRDDILSIQKTLENYVTNLKPNMDIDYEKVQALAQKYGCSTPVDKGHKPFIKALLQRKALDDILELSKDSKDSANKGEDVKLELDIENKTQELLELIENFSASRSGTDEIAKVASIKVRQQVYGILGNRGFADVTDSKGSHIHDFIIYVIDNLNNTMNQYRKINDPAKKSDTESIAPKLIQDIYKLFFYLVNVQEPRVEYKFCETGSKIDPNVMKGNWDEDDVPQLCVDICSFPMIGRDLDSPNWKIYTHAKVFPHDPSKTS